METAEFFVFFIVYAVSRLNFLRQSLSAVFHFNHTDFANLWKKEMLHLRLAVHINLIANEQISGKFQWNKKP